ncbi:MAG: diguanylate cyclase [Candidatus Solibacter sp.]|jgi:hypothetical protein|nr:diguanylate cyclase [Candidatus Solibacter sp.]
MKRSMASTLAMVSGAALGFAAKRVQWRRASPGDTAMRRLTTYFILPVWIGAGFVDYLWHRRTRIETTSGLEESLMHSLMMVEGAPIVLSALFFEINAGVLGWMIGLSFVHELTVLCDLSFTAPRRVIPAGEQVTHTFLEAPPFLVTAAAISTHWEQFLALLGRGSERARYRIRLQRPPVSSAHVFLIFAALALLDALPHADELRRCVEAKKAGRIGEDTPACLPEVFS